MLKEEIEVEVGVGQELVLFARNNVGAAVGIVAM